MKDRAFKEEINLLNHTVNSFSDEMKERLWLKAAEGKRGWDGKGSLQLIAELRRKRSIDTPEDAVDMVNMIMFIHKALKEGR